VKLRNFAVAATIAGALGYGAIVVGAPAAHADHPLWDCGSYPADICANFPWNSNAGTGFTWHGDRPPPPELGQGEFFDCHWDWSCIRDRLRGSQQ
jgi:hypothetical protein